MQRGPLGRAGVQCWQRSEGRRCRMADASERVEELLRRPYWVVDLLPLQVPTDAPGQFFAIERWRLEGSRAVELRQRFADVLLGINCYYDLVVLRDDETEGTLNPVPEKLVRWILRDHGMLNAYLPEQDALVAVPSQSTCMTVYDPSPELLGLVRQLAASVGLFVWQPPQ